MTSELIRAECVCPAPMMSEIDRQRRVVEMLIEVPLLPPVECSPNWRGHFMARYRAGKQFKQDVFRCTIDAKNRLSQDELNRLPLQKAELNLLFVVAEWRVRDADNWLARFKPGLDALCAEYSPGMRVRDGLNAGIIASDDAACLRIGSIEFEVDPNRAPLTIIEIAGVLR